MTEAGETGARIGAVVLAAGASRRMGQPKMVLPWGSTTVIEQVTRTLAAAGAQPVVVVTGGAREQVEAALDSQPVHLVHNPNFEQGEMLSSLTAGLESPSLAASPEVAAALVALGDQPAIQVEVARQVISVYWQTGARLVVPSYRNRRGHPWLVDRNLWPALINLPRNRTMRDFLNLHSGDIHYVTVETPTVLKDVDTPEDYYSQRPQ